jgi:putative transposase
VKKSGGRAPQSKENKAPYKGNSVEELRIRLIERLCRLRETHLPDVEALLATLESDAVGNSRQTTIIGPALQPSTHHKDWPHAPVHRLSDHGTFIVTASTVAKHHYFRGEQNLTLLENQLLSLSKQHEVIHEAWAVYSNHYHFVAHTTGVENQMANLIARLHYDTAEEVNRRDGTPGRQVWFNYWETALTFEKSYLARLNYVHQNAVKHGLVRLASNYRWCSAAWFERTATPAQMKTIYGFRTDRVKVDDDYQPEM